MKRDMDLCRQILFELERLETASGWVDIRIAERNESDITYHVRLLDEAGLIEAEDISTNDGVDWKPRRLTWEGHEFIESARNDGFWEKAKDLTVAKTGTLSFEFLKIALAELAKAAIGNSP